MIAQLGAIYTFCILHELAAPVMVYPNLMVDGHEVPPSTMPPVLKMSLLEQVWYSERYAFLSFCISLIGVAIVYLIHSNSLSTERVRRISMTVGVVCSIGVSAYGVYEVVKYILALQANLPVI